MTHTNKTQKPKIALGTWSWGSGAAGGDQVFGNHLTIEDLQPVVDTAMAKGFNLWDTAAVYGEGSSETILGELLKKYDRSSYLLSTKFTPQIATGPEETAMENMLAGSFKRLNTDYIDIYWIHNPFDVEKWTPYLIPLIQSGKIKSVGVSNHNLSQIKRVTEILGQAGVKLAAVQNHYSLLYRSSEEAGILEYCLENDIDFYAYMVLEQGVLTGKYSVDNPLPEGSGRAATYNANLPKLAALIDALAQLGNKYDAKVADIATSWAINKGAVPIVGVTNEKYIASEERAQNIKLSEQEIAELERLATLTNIDTKGSWENSMLS